MLKPFKLAKKILTFSLIFTLASCAHSKLDDIDPIDSTIGLTNSDFRDTIIDQDKSKKIKAKKAEQSSEKSKESEAPIPTVSKLISIPSTPKIGGDKTISFSVTEQVPLKDVLIELGRVTKIDVDLDPSISGGIILNAKNRPLKEVIDRIATLGQLRYSYENGVLHFERDSPYLKNYFVDYLIDGQLWSDVETNLTAILAKNSDSESSAAASFSSNKSAGIISVFATEKQQEAVENYLNDVEKSASAQVLIEAKLVEVTLKDTFNSGISYGAPSVGTTSVAAAYSGSSSTTISSTDTSTAAIQYILNGTDLNVSISALETFGTTRTISSPRIHAINNQKATLNFSDKLVYFKVDASSTVTSSTSTVTASQRTSTKQEESVGTLLEITPSINLRTNEITLSVKPTLSVQSKTIADPASPVDSDGDVITDLINYVPVVQTRTIDTIAKIKSGNILVIGGLMKDSTSSTDSGVPFLQKIPILGWFFKSISKDSEIIETVIFIKASIIKSSTPASNYDRDFHRKFDSSKRPYFD